MNITTVRKIVSGFRSRKIKKQNITVAQVKDNDE
jgi:hypothetical protein